MTKCPYCSVEMEKVFERQHIEVPSISTGSLSKLLVRFPMMKCPICREKFHTQETNSTINEAVTEFIDRELQSSSKELEKSTASFVISIRRFFLAIGFFLGTLLQISFKLIDVNVWIGVFCALVVILSYAFFYVGPELVIEYTRRKIKRWRNEKT